MEEFNEQEEQIKDPNQLDLFAGVLFTPEQEKMIDDYIKRSKNSADIAEKANQQHVDLLYTNGFSFEEFTNTFKREIVTREVTLGYVYSKTNFNVELTFESFSGDISLKGIQHNKGKIEEKTFWVDFDKDKIQCSSIQDQYRYIKPKTLLEKLRQHNEKQRCQCENYIKKNGVKQYTIEKYQKLYPNAKVTHIQEWTRNMGYFDTIQVKFPSCSYVQFYVPNEIDREQVYKKHDAGFVDLTVGEVLEKFNNQEGSN